MNEQSGETPAAHRSGEPVAMKLLRITEKARQDRKVQFTSLYHLMNKELLRDCFKRLPGKRAAGIDGVTKEEYGKDLEANLEELVGRLQRMGYRPQPVRRTYIPKGGTGKLRPLGIPALEDKLVQTGLVRILETIYEEEFIERSYGFRPGRGCHDALRELSEQVEHGRTNYIFEADIRSFFDSVEWDWIMRFLERRVGDKRVVRMIKRFLMAGIMEDGEVRVGEEGAPQGASLSPLLANIYLHYALDLWFEKEHGPKCKGRAILIRYADDFVVCFENRDDAMRFGAELTERLAKFGLEVEPTKTKVLEFGKRAAGNAKARGEKPGTFDFLGFTHYCGKGRDGRRFRMKRKTAGKKFRARIVEFKEWIKRHRNRPLRWIMQQVAAKVRGHFGYYGVTDNLRGIDRYAEVVKLLLYKWLNRRSQRRSFTWPEFQEMLKRFPLPKPRILVSLFPRL